MQLPKILALCALAICGQQAGAQTMFRCGSTFSQQPCSPGAVSVALQGAQQPLVAPVDSPASPETVQAAKAACVASLTKWVAFKDPDSIKISAVDRRATWHAPIGDTRVPARIYVLKVNAKGSGGGYTGERPYQCNLDLAERTVLSVVPLL